MLFACRKRAQPAIIGKILRLLPGGTTLSAHAPLRLISVVASTALILGTLAIGLPAAAAEEPTQTATSEATPEATPTSEPAPETTAEPAPEATSEPTPEATSEPTASTETIELTGQVTLTGDGEAADDVQMFRVIGEGYLVADFGAFDTSSFTYESITVRFAVPGGLKLSGTESEKFDALAAASFETPIIAIDRDPIVSAGSKATTKGMINVSPSTPAVHKVFAVLVTPQDFVGGTTVAVDQTAAKVAQNVANANTLWSAQSNGAITFELVGTTTWYESAYDCKNASGPVGAPIWAEAEAYAKSQLGYVDGFNNHLALFFPQNTDCGDTGGLGTVGTSLNTGGNTWTKGTNNTYAYQILAHELGHNLGFGHANWADCTDATPYPGFLGNSSCTIRGYGDIVDPMGGGTAVAGGGGSLSAPSAIRTGVWNSSAYKVATGGTSTYTLNAVSSNTGLRSVVVEDTDGTNYFIEFRNLTGRDAPYAGYTCGASSLPTKCVSPAGVRVTRLEVQPFTNTLKGYPGDDTFVIGRVIGGVKRTNYVAGEFFNSKSSGGINVTVNSVTATTATVTITKPKTTLTPDRVFVYTSSSYDNYYRVGDALTAYLGAYWEADSYSYQWYRYPSTKISGATKSTYTLTSKDVKKCLYVKVTGKGGGETTTAKAPSASTGYDCYGIVKSGIMPAGSATISNVATPLKAQAGGFVAGASYKYQWYRGTAKIKGATKSTYTPSQSDRDKALKVVITASKSGFSSKSATSIARNFTVTATGAAPTIGGALQVGKTLTATDTQTYASPNGAINPPTRTWQWYRTGKAIAGATSQTYVLAAADVAKVITVRVSGGAPGYIPSLKTSIATTKIAKGTIAGFPASPSIAKGGTTSIVLTAAAAGTETGTRTAWQWFRNGKAISKATKASYTLSSTDYGTLTSVRATVTKAGYDTLVLTNTPQSYSIVASPAVPVITGNLAAAATDQPANTLTVGAGRTYSNGPATLAYQWFRDGKAIAGATANTFTLSPTDKGKTFSARIVASRTGFQSSTATSAKTPKLGSLYFTGSAATITKAAETTALTAVPNVTQLDAKTTFQWYAGSTAIKKATRASYTPSAAYAGKLISVRVTVSKLDYTTVVKTSAAVDVTVQASGVPVLNDTTPAVGNELTVALPTYSTQGTPFTPALTDVTYQWYASGKVITGAKSASYTVSSKYKAKTISVRVTVKKTGWLSKTTTSAASAKVTAV